MGDSPLVKAASGTGFITFGYAILIGTVSVVYFLGAAFRNTKREILEFEKSTENAYRETQLVETELFYLAKFFKVKGVSLQGIWQLRHLLLQIRHTEATLSEFAIQLEYRSHERALYRNKRAHERAQALANLTRGQTTSSQPPTQPADDQAPSVQETKDKTKSNEATAQSPDDQSTGAESAKKKEKISIEAVEPPSDEQATDIETTGDQTTGDQTTGIETTGNQTTDTQASDPQTTGAKTTGVGTVGHQTVDNPSAGDQTTDRRTPKDGAGPSLFYLVFMWMFWKRGELQMNIENRQKMASRLLLIQTTIVALRIEAQNSQGGFLTSQKKSELDALIGLLEGDLNNSSSEDIEGFSRV